MQGQSDHPTEAGVEALLDRLQAEGVRAGEAAAAKLIADAEARARTIRETAEREADAMIEAARKEASNLERGGKEALKVAMRDTVLDLKQALASRFKGEIGRLVTKHLRDETLLRQLILEIAGKTAQDADLAGAEKLEVLLPDDVIGLDELRRDPTALRDGKLGHFVLGSAGELLREGVTLGRTSDGAVGIQVRLEDQDIVLDLTDKAVADVILQHLQPRFRALLEGVIG